VAGSEAGLGGHSIDCSLIGKANSWARGRLTSLWNEIPEPEWSMGPRQGAPSRCDHGRTRENGRKRTA
jgi:hypothetical protein